MCRGIFTNHSLVSLTSAAYLTWGMYGIAFQRLPYCWIICTCVLCKMLQRLQITSKAVMKSTFILVLSSLIVQEKIPLLNISRSTVGKMWSEESRKIRGIHRNDREIPYVHVNTTTGVPRNAMNIVVWEEKVPGSVQGDEVMQYTTIPSPLKVKILQYVCVQVVKETSTANNKSMIK